MSMLLHSGRYFEYNRVHQHVYDIQDIAHALAHLCRYTGHCRTFYSVAQHSVLTSYLVPPEDALAALMHDASEAYLGDVNTHLKRLLPDYKELEEAVELAIATQWRLPHPLPDTVKHADLEMLMTEKRDLMPYGTPDQDWPAVPPREDFKIIPWPSARAKRRFLERHNQLNRP